MVKRHVAAWAACVRACVCVWQWIGVGVYSCSGAALERWAYSKAANRAPSLFKPHWAAAAPGLKPDRHARDRLTKKLRRSPFSATPAEGGSKVTGKEKRKQVLSVCRATRLGDGLEHNSEEPHEVLTNGWMKKVPAESLIVTVPFNLRWGVEGITRKMPTTQKCLSVGDQGYLL